MVKQYIKEKLAEDDSVHENYIKVQNIRKELPYITKAAEAVQVTTNLATSGYEQLKEQLESIHNELKELHPEILAYREQVGISSDNIRSVHIFIQEVTNKFLGLDPNIYGSEVEQLKSLGQQALGSLEQMADILQNMRRKSKREEDN